MTLQEQFDRRQSSRPSLRVLMIARSDHDVQVTEQAFHEVGLDCDFCRSIPQICAEAAKGAGVLVIHSSATRHDSLRPLYALLKEQPAWSSLPIVFVVGQHQEEIGALYELGNVAVLRQPVHLVTLLSVVRAGVESRRKQYELCDLLERETRALRMLQHADHRKDEFLATLAHELRNPLGPLQNALEYMKLHDALDTEQEDVRKLMLRQVHQLKRLVDDLLDVSRITRGSLRLSRRTFDFRESVAAGIEACRPMIETAQLQLIVDLGDEPLTVLGDHHRLTQVVTNLLTNAARYNVPQGQVKVACQRGEKAHTLTVADTGIGIPKDKLESVFEMFHQHDVESERGQAGLGIGLTLVRRITQLHGGRVTASSAGANEGSTFTLQLPASSRSASRTDPAAEEPDAPARHRGRVLIVEDLRANRVMLRKLVEFLVEDVDVAEDGLEALEIANQRVPQAIISDIAMPKMSGDKLAKTIRADTRFDQTVLIALTGYNRDEVRQRVREAGFDHHLTKPVDFASLETLLGTVFADSQRD